MWLCIPTFCREFISNTSETGLLLVQCEAGHMCQNLIACAQFIIWDEYQEMQNTDKSFIILLIVQIPRYAVKRFTGFHVGLTCNSCWANLSKIKQQFCNKQLLVCFCFLSLLVLGCIFEHCFVDLNFKL